MSEESSVGFHEMGLDDRILKAISKLGWATPTLIQERAIPLALDGKDILARAKTGSGKTAAYIVPIIQKVLSSKHTSIAQEVRALVLAPSRELCKQIQANIKELSFACSREVVSVDVSGQVDVVAQKPLLMEKPDIVVGTPSRILMHIHAGNLKLKKSLEILVIDEADLLFTFGFEKDTKQVLGHIPSIYQSFLMSATLSDEVQQLKKLILHNPVILKLEEPELPVSDQLTQYLIKCEETDKFVIIYTLFKLCLIRGRTLIFLSNVDRCYRMKLYLEQFGIPSCALNAELPVASRCHIVEQFNEGLYDILIASDEKTLEEIGPVASTSTDESGKKSKRKKDKEYSASRGIDFRSISNVINFDFPRTVEAYIHRVGRTARANSKGTALSFVSMKEAEFQQKVEEAFADECGEGNSIFKPYNFKMEEIEAFKYRAKDALRSVTTIAIREARLKEIKKELLESQKLKSYFEDNPRDLQVLRHDRALHIVKLQPHLKDVPEYIVPPTLQKLMKRKVVSTVVKKFKKRKTSEKPRYSKSKTNYTRQQKDPLRSLKFTGIKKKKM
ncbi:putative ATP-dependent RNA helicase ddx56 [Chamberlinius hualienensis]